ncbi:MAG: MATE family efflux transporter [Deltaproteobacteria bacterium]|nr:MATE family efflux transporter [Deltaproteobacteria bacterium]MBW2121130.1 MATE family efflux transporter [Deltaproteobacteria bacterium]
MFRRVENKPVPGGYREILSLSYPLILSTASMTVMHFVDRMFLSWYSERAIAAATPAGITSFTIICFFMGVSQYTTTIVAQYFGAEDHRACGTATWQGVFFSLASYMAIVLFIPLGPIIFRWGGHAAQIIDLEITYFSILMWGGGLVPLQSALAGFFTGRGDTKTTMIANMAGNAVNGVLDYGLIFGRLGLPEMGLAGAAIATVLASIVPVVILGALFLTAKNNRRFGTRRVKLESRLFGKLLKYGMPAGFQFFLDMGCFTLFVILVGRLGTVELAATNIAFSIDMLAFMPVIGVSIATSTLVGQYMGRGEPDLAEKTTYSALTLALIYMGVMALVFVLFPVQLLSIFKTRGHQAGDFAAIIGYGRYLLIMVAVYSVFDALGIAFSAGLKGAGDTRFVMWTSVIAGWTLFVPPVYLTVSVFHGGLFAAWVWATLYIIVLALVYLWRFRQGKWKTIDMIGKDRKPAAIHPIPVTVEKRVPGD